jgi:trans-2,3-dihydro-3-hydroxyanthranilate isomerase
MTGNQLAVVHDADGVAEERMARFARETKLSETTFVQSPSHAGADFRNRIWTMREELPFAGHPSCGTAVAEALHRGERQVRYVQQTPAGLQPVDVEIVDERRGRVSMLVEPAAFGPELDLPPQLVPDPDPRLPAQIVATGVKQITAPVRSLDHPAPDFGDLAELLGTHGALTLYWARVADGEHAQARSFGLDPHAVNEDPATGSSAAPLMAYLHERTGISRLTIDQGAEMGRPSRIECSIEDGRVRIGGEAVVVMTGSVTL